MNALVGIKKIARSGAHTMLAGSAKTEPGLIRRVFTSM